MRKVVCLIMAMVMCFALTCPAFAAENEFVPSISYKDHPEVVPYPDGYPGRLVDGSGELVDYVTDDCLVITPVAKADESDRIPEEARKILKEVYANLKDGSMSLPYSKVDSAIDPDAMVIRDLFDVSILCDKYEVNDEQHLEVVLDLGVAPDVDVTVMVYADGEWRPAVNVVNNGDGTVTVTFDRIGTVAFSVEGTSIVVPAPGTGDADMGRIAFYGVVCALSLVALIALLALNAKKNRA